jgi:nucleotide-binding universal stress UspA family protein
MRILVATDGSQHAMRAAHVALRFARELKRADVVVVNVGHIPEVALAASGVSGGPVDLGGLIESLDQAGQRILHQTAEIFTAANIEVRRDYRTGQPAAEIVEAAREHQVDLIVIGSRGLGQIGGLVLGSVSERVLHLAHGPVLIVR